MAELTVMNTLENFETWDSHQSGIFSNLHHVWALYYINIVPLHKCRTYVSVVFGTKVGKYSITVYF